MPASELRDVDLNLLVALDALLAERNVTRAAQRLAISQSALSTQLARLRAVFGDPLMLPQARGMLPTARALELALPLRNILADLRQLLRNDVKFDPATSDATIRIATTGALHFALCVPLVAIVRSQAPGMRLSLYQLNVATIARQVEHGDVDLVLATPAYLNDQWKTRPVFRERFVTVLRKKHPALARPIDLDAFCALDHLIVTPSGGGTRGAVDDALEAIGRARRVVVAVQNFLVVPYILEVTDLISTLPSRLSRSFPDSLAAFEPPVPVDGFTVHAAWHPRSQTDPAHQWIRKRLESIGARFNAAESVAPEPQ